MARADQPGGPSLLALALERFRCPAPRAASWRVKTLKEIVSEAGLEPWGMVHSAASSLAEVDPPPAW
jgi:hypothetical protein